MKIYLLSLAAGVLVGMIYAALNVRSPAPPIVALVGLLGILIGEQILPVSRQLLSGERVSLSWLKTTCHQHVFGQLPANTGASKGSPPPA